MTLNQLFVIITTIFKSCWQLLTSINFYGVNPAELSFACLLLWFVIARVIKPIFGGSSHDDT